MKGFALTRYEEEEEFDAVTDSLAPKEIYLAAPEAGSTKAIRRQLEGISFEAGFTSQQVPGRKPNEGLPQRLHTSGPAECLAYVADRPSPWPHCQCNAGTTQFD